MHYDNIDLKRALMKLQKYLVYVGILALSNYDLFGMIKSRKITQLFTIKAVKNLSYSKIYANKEEALTDALKAFDDIEKQRNKILTSSWSQENAQDWTGLKISYNLLINSMCPCLSDLIENHPVIKEKYQFSKFKTVFLTEALKHCSRDLGFKKE
jgi:hypothetical protein